MRFSDRNMKVAVLGGTGFVGSYIVDALIDAGHSVSLLVRPGSEARASPADRVDIVSGQVGSPTAVAETVATCDAVIYCIGILRERPRKGITFEALQYEGVVRTVEAALDAGARRFLLMSANGVKVPGTPYQETKKRAEDFLLTSGLEGTVFRPSVIFGDPHGAMEIASQIYAQMVRPPIPAAGFFTGARPGSGQIMMSPVHAGDVAAAFVSALEDPGTIGRIYELGGPEAISWSEMIRRVASAAGRRKWLLPYPVRLAWLAALVFDWLPFFPATRDQLVMLAEGNTADPAVIESLIGRAPRPFGPGTLGYLAGR
jgi:NADH dehydrogenase